MKNLKRIIALGLAASMVFTGGILLSNTYLRADGPIGMANPVTEYNSFEEMNAAAGTSFVLPQVNGMSGESFSVIDCGSYKIAQYKFSLAGYNCTLRNSSYTDEDISGVYIDAAPAFKGGVPNGVEYAQGEGMLLARWVNDYGQFVFSVDENNIINMDMFKKVVFELVNNYDAIPILSENVAVYRLNNPATGEHLYTSDINEVAVLQKNAGWENEGIFWYAPNVGTPVYRLFLPGMFHLYTTDVNEVAVLTTEAGWLPDNGGKPLFYSGGDVSVYRLYNDTAKIHLLTADENEYKTLDATAEWTGEGTKLFAEQAGDRKPAFNPAQRAGTYVNTVEEEIEGSVVKTENYIILNADGTGKWIGQDDLDITEWTESTITVGGSAMAYTYADKAITIVDNGAVYKFTTKQPNL